MKEPAPPVVVNEKVEIANQGVSEKSPVKESNIFDYSDHLNTEEEEGRHEVYDFEFSNGVQNQRVSQAKPKQIPLSESISLMALQKTVPRFAYFKNDSSSQQEAEIILSDAITSIWG